MKTLSSINSSQSELFRKRRILREGTIRKIADSLIGLNKLELMKNTYSFGGKCKYIGTKLMRMGQAENAVPF